ncbi:MAG: hypothetical protein ACRDT6_22150 [Micromonosporaceae bacterium]
MRDPFGGWTSRFPQSPSGGRIIPDPASPSQMRPFGLRFTSTAPVVEAKHQKPPTRQNLTKPTTYTTDGKNPTVQPDTEPYVVID